MPGEPNRQPEVCDSCPLEANEEVRELTLTDKLNKKLLMSLLERMNAGNQFERFIDNKDAENGNEDDFA